MSRFSGADPSQPIGAVATANTNGVSGACSGGSDTAAYAVNLTTSAANAFVYSAVGIRRKSHSAGAGFTEIDEIHGGSGGSTAGVATQGMAAETPGAQTVNGSVSSSVDWGVVALEIQPL
ncbi:MAG: hypothetical protein WBG93_04275 [Thermoanaerobaculia bacterium]